MNVPNTWYLTVRTICDTIRAKSCLTPPGLGLREREKARVDMYPKRMINKQEHMTVERNKKNRYEEVSVVMYLTGLHSDSY